MYTMLDGDTLFAVEDLEFSKFSAEGGENLIFSILEARILGEDSGTWSEGGETAG